MENLAKDLMFATPSLLPGLFLGLADRKTSHRDWSVHWLSMMTVSSWCVCILEISDLMYYISVYSIVNVILSFFGSFIPGAFLGYRGYLILRDSLMQSIVVARDFRLDHYQLLSCHFCVSLIFIILSLILFA